MAKSISNVPSVPAPKTTISQWLKNNDHGHIRRSFGKELARCGGPIGCPVCQAEQLLTTLMETNKRLANELQQAKAIRDSGFRY